MTVIQHKYLLFDIEAVRDSDGEELINKKKIKPKANLKDPEKIKKDIAEKRQKMRDDAAFSAATARVACIVFKDLITGRVHKVFNDDERKLLLEAGSILVNLYPSHKLVAHNNDLYDYPFLGMRFMKHDLGVPNHLRTLRDWKGVSDTMKLFHSSSQCKMNISLNDWAAFFKMDGKIAAGSDVAGMWDRHQNGDTSAIPELVQYCAQDVEILGEIMKRYSKEFTPTVMPQAPTETMDVTNIF